jgi:hypothetical protein
VDGAVPVQITSDTPAELKNQALKTFTIGPTVDRDFWSKECSDMDISRGPCMVYNFIRKTLLISQRVKPNRLRSKYWIAGNGMDQTARYPKITG